MEAPGYVAWAGTIPPDGAIAAERELYASIVEVKTVDHRQSSVRIGIESFRVVNVAEGLCRTRVGIHFIEKAELGSHENFPVRPHTYVDEEEPRARIRKKERLLASASGYPDQLGEAEGGSGYDEDIAVASNG